MLDSTPLVTPTSQIVGVQAVVSAMNLKKGNPKYSNPSNQFIALVKGEYGQTPVPVDPSFRKQITGSPKRFLIIQTIINIRIILFYQNMEM